MTTKAAAVKAFRREGMDADGERHSPPLRHSVKEEARTSIEKLRDGWSPITRLTESLMELKTDGTWNSPLSKLSLERQTPSPGLKFTSVKKFSRLQSENFFSSPETDVDDSPFLQERCSQRTLNSLASKCHSSMRAKKFVVDRLSPVNAADQLSCDDSPDFPKKNSHMEGINARTDLPKCDTSNRACNEVLHKDQKQVSRLDLKYSASPVKSMFDPENKMLDGKPLKALDSSRNLTSLYQLLSSPVFENKENKFSVKRKQREAQGHASPDQDNCNIKFCILHETKKEDCHNLKSKTLKQTQDSCNDSKPPKKKRAKNGDDFVGFLSQRKADKLREIESLNLMQNDERGAEESSTLPVIVSAETELMISTALSRADDHQNLIGDFSRPYLLSLVKSKCHGLVAISPHMLAAVIVGEYEKDVEACIIVDCRYPYEYEAGHIRGALNIYTKDEIISTFLKSSRYHSSATQPLRTILVFHCEFSSERGPKLMHFLRSRDREIHGDSYPVLYYPEIYLLEGGYKDFFDSHKTLCEPVSYKPMVHVDHLEDLKHFRSKSKSWTSGRPERKHRSVRMSRQLSEEISPSRLLS